MSEPQLKKQYKEQVRPEIVKLREFSNELQAARLEKIVINSGVGATSDKPN